MSVEYYPCNCCGESVYDEYVERCVKCGKRICTSCVVNDDINSEYAGRYCVKFDGSEEQKEEYRITEKDIEKGWVQIGKPIDNTGIDPKYCPFCNGDKIHNDDLLNYLLIKYNLSKDEAKRVLTKI